LIIIAAAAAFILSVIFSLSVFRRFTTLTPFHCFAFSRRHLSCRFRMPEAYITPMIAAITLMLIIAYAI
jgi:hypothetical protein